MHGPRPSLYFESLLQIAQEEGYLESNIVGRLKVPRAPKKIIQTFSEEQLRQPLAATRSSREKAILGLFIDTGIRVTELTSLRIEDLDLDRNLVVAELILQENM